MSRFVYGSLMAPEVLQALLGRVPTRAPAAVAGFHRYRIPDRIYPALARGLLRTSTRQTLNLLLLLRAYV